MPRKPGGILAYSGPRVMRTALTDGVPGQGGVLRDKAYLTTTADVFDAIIAQVHAALARGLQAFPEVRRAVNVESIGLRYTPGTGKLSDDFNPWVDVVVRKVIQESFDGVSR